MAIAIIENWKNINMPKPRLMAPQNSRKIPGVLSLRRVSGLREKEYPFLNSTIDDSCTGFG
ncbi:MAG: hypothetical protein ACKO26_19960 [Planctomycetota bacterium]